ncbi:MAG: macro domain-containing protein [Planctomycetaceae bacterium]|nr:macro domain-containing protein [Planctomycetaceae bacterium]
MQKIHLQFVHPDLKVCKIYRARFSSVAQVEIHPCPFEKLPPHNCFVTAGNAYGIMTAGIDAAVIGFFGQELMGRVQTRILDDYLGEQPVGSAFVLETGHAGIPFLCHSPTMRTPGSIEGTEKVYIATWAALLSIYQFNIDSARKIETVCFPAMGAGFGGVPYEESARQMAVAFEHFLNLPHRTPDWEWVAARQRKIFYDGSRRMCK